MTFHSKIRTICFLFAVLVPLNGARAASAENITTIESMVTDTSVPADVREKNIIDGKDMGVTASFVYQGIRYTVFALNRNLDPVDRSGYLSFIVHEYNKKNKKTKIEFADIGANGTVNIGIDEKRQKVFNDATARGLEHLKYWQRKLDDAVTALLSYKRERPRVSSQ